MIVVRKESSFCESFLSSIAFAPTLQGIRHISKALADVQLLKRFSHSFLFGKRKYFKYSHKRADNSLLIKQEF